MKIKITNEGVNGVDAITIFVRQPEGTTNLTCIEGGQEYELDWDPDTQIRYEVVPWIRIPPAS